MKQYSVILADPPWNYNNAGLDSSAELQYPTMSDAEIADLPIGNLAAQDAVLLLTETVGPSSGPLLATSKRPGDPLAPSAWNRTKPLVTKRFRRR